MKAYRRERNKETEFFILGVVFFCQDLPFHWCYIFFLMFYKELIVLSTSQMFVNIEQGRKATTVTDSNSHDSFIYKKRSWMKECKASHRGISHAS